MILIRRKNWLAKKKGQTKKRRYTVLPRLKSTLFDNFGYF